jgi:hypothetical protein
MANISPRWSKPSTILFATEIPTNEKAFAFALAQAAELSASIIVFHANGRLDVTDTEASGPPLVNYATARAMKECPASSVWFGRALLLSPVKGASRTSRPTRQGSRHRMQHRGSVRIGLRPNTLVAPRAED